MLGALHLAVTSSRDSDCLRRIECIGCRPISAQMRAKTARQPFHPGGDLVFAAVCTS
jgi:hypothetical protein